MHYAPMKPPTKAQIDAANQKKQEREIRYDISKINELFDSTDYSSVLELHRCLDGKYQYCIADWGKSMRGYVEGNGFNYEDLDILSLQENLKMMKFKLEAFSFGWNAIQHSKSVVPVNGPDVNVTVNNSVTVNVTFEQVRDQINDMTSLTDAQTQEALEKVAEIEAVVKGAGSKKSKWERIKPVLVWLADKSFDVAMAMLPLLMQVKGWG